MDLLRLMDVAVAAARAAVDVQRRYIGTVRVESWTEKAAADFVTHVDEEAEAAAVATIRESFPHHDILAEEAAGAGTGSETGSDWLWIVDPLDGTTNYLHNYPSFSASVAVTRGGELLAGAVVSGVTGECWAASRGNGAFLDGRPIHVSAISELRHALIGTGFPFRKLELLPGYLDQFAAVLPLVSGIRRAGSAAIDLCHVATGLLDGFWELYLAPWDIAAGSLIIREAGGVITTVDGGDDVLSGGGVVAGNPTIHGHLLRAIDHPERREPPDEVRV
ncbi:MAG TPA: inositol monophosphatase family protein [Longimicrobiales bacterium]|nr:inositol monophosphatase family protein [Longimicrobiales bacterium]